MKIRLIGKRNNLGIGIHFAGFADAIGRIQGIGNMVEEVDFENQQQFYDAISKSKPDDVNISFIAGNIHEFFLGHNVQWCVFESTKIPTTVKINLTPADSVWVPSSWGAQILLAHNIASNKIHIVPEGVDPDMYHPFSRSKHTRPFRFLFVGKYETRKSLEETIRAFAVAFGNDPAIELIIKSHYLKPGINEIEQLVKTLQLDNVTAVIGAVENMSAIYNQCDILVAATKGEAWGLPIIEAAASGLPIITTNYSGHTEYLQHITSSMVPVDYDLVPVTCDTYRSHYPETDNNWGVWAQPSVSHLAECMMLSKTHNAFLAQNALKNSNIIRKEFSWAMSANCALKTLQNQGLLVG